MQSDISTDMLNAHKQTAAIARSYGILEGAAISSIEARGVSLFAESAGRAARQWGKYVIKGAGVIGAIAGSSVVFAADLFTHSDEAGRYSDCIKSCTLIYGK
ncbi:hypothetical protein AAKU64_002173 [Undibacterium sp. GrIS 1.8]|uniref:hypothetical protein n=2 Tax=unclassified Undibacterium TaxID=2630295 RepID=UPI003394A341